MCCFEDALRNCTGFMDPYGDMPLAGGMTASAEIDIMDTDNGVRVSVVKTPPRDGRIRLSEVLEGIMGSYMASPCAADQGKQKPEKQDENPEKDATMDSSKPDGFKEQGSQPWATGKSDGSSQPTAATEDEGRKEKK